MTSLSADLTTIALLQALAGLNMNEPLEHRSILDMTHTPTPWGIEDTAAILWVGPLREDGAKVDQIVTSFDNGPEYRRDYREKQRSNAEFIVTAVNAFEANQARIAVLEKALAALELQALQSNVNHPSNEWGQEALGMARAALSIPS